MPLQKRLAVDSAICATRSPFTRRVQAECSMELRTKAIHGTASLVPNARIANSLDSWGFQTDRIPFGTCSGGGRTRTDRRDMA